MKKQMTKRIAAIILSLIMLLSLSVPTMAENVDTFYYGQITAKGIFASGFGSVFQIKMINNDGTETIYECNEETRVNGICYQDIDALHESITVFAYAKFTATDGTIDILYFDDTSLSLDNVTYNVSNHTFDIQDLDTSNIPIYCYNNGDGYYYQPYLDENHSYNINVYDYAIEITDYNALNGLNTIKYIDVYSEMSTDFSQIIWFGFSADDTSAETHIQLYDSNSNLIYDEVYDTNGYDYFAALNNANSEYCIKLWQENNDIVSSPVYVLSCNTTYIPIYYGCITAKEITNSAFGSVLQVKMINNDGTETIYECNEKTFINGYRYYPDNIDVLNESINVGDYAKFTAIDGKTINIINIAEKDSLTTTLRGISCVNESNNACRYTIEAVSNGAPSGEFIVAVYDINGKLIGIKHETKRIIFEETIVDTVAVNGTPHTYKAFFWNSLEDLMPLCNNVIGSVSK